MKQSFPDEVLELDKSVRTLDLTHNKLGNYLVFGISLSFSIAFNL